MIFKYGSHTHPEGQVNLLSHQRVRRYSPRGARYSQIGTLHIRVHVKSANSTALLTDLAALETAYLKDGQGDAGLYYSDGTTATKHILTNSNSLDGVRVVRYSYLEDNGAEHAFQRTVDIVLQGEYLQVESQVLQWRETFTTIGTGGPLRLVIPTFSGPVQVILAQTTPQTFIQSGFAEGLEGYVAANPPLYPALEQQQQRRISHTGPERGTNKAIQFVTRWTYYMTSLTPQQGNPGVFL